MGISSWIIPSLLLLFGYIFTDIAGVKIITHFLIIFLGMNRLYTYLIHRYINFNRTKETDKLFIGFEQRVYFKMSNQGKFPIHSMRVKEYIDIKISLEPVQYLQAPLQAESVEEMVYLLHGRKRGLYHVGPVVYEFTDLINYFTYQYELDLQDAIFVFPQIYRITNLNLKSLQPYGNIKNILPIFEDTSMMTGVREYQQGDEVRRINWKISAKNDKFYVNTYQPSISAGSVFLINLFEGDYPKRRTSDYTEECIELSASILREFYFSQQNMQVICNGKNQINGKGHDEIYRSETGTGDNLFHEILTYLSVVDSSDKYPFPNIFDKLENRLNWGTCIYIITPKLEQNLIFRLIELRKKGHSIHLIHFGPEIHHELSLKNIGFQSLFAKKDRGIFYLIPV